jgi:hypothetical protein
MSGLPTHDLSGASDEELVQLTVGLSTHVYGEHKERAHIAENELNLRLKREVAALRDAMVTSSNHLETFNKRLIGLTVAAVVLAAAQLAAALVLRSPAPTRARVDVPVTTLAPTPAVVTPSRR